MITLDYALQLIQEKKRRILQLRHERRVSTTVQFEEGMTEDFIQRPERTVDDLTSEITFLTNQVQTLVQLVSDANLRTQTNFDINGSNVNLGKLILWLRDSREELPDLQYLSKLRGSKAKVNERHILAGQPTIVPIVKVTEIQLNPKAYEAAAKKLEVQIKVAQNIINGLNQSVSVPFDDAEYTTVTA
jgi:hypothetical protein